VAGQVVLSADHRAIVTDLNDVAFVAATVSSETAVTFSVAGPGTIIAVDSGSMALERRTVCLPS
jgi:hypothetical protein